MNVPKKRHFGLSLHWDERLRQEQYAYCLENQFAIEIRSFAWPDLWNDREQRRALVSLYEQELKDVPLVRSLHGPFQDVIPHAQDRDVRRIAKGRIKEAIEIGARLGVARFIFHTGINTVVTDPNYYVDVVERQVDFWSEIIEEFPHAIICLENMWEPSPSLHRQIIDRIACPRVKVCLDTGHVNVYSKVPLLQWLEELMPHLAHFHLHDNNGDVDSHLAVGTGTTPWTQFVETSLSFPEDAILMLELDSLDKQRASLAFLAPGKSGDRCFLDVEK